MKKTLQLLFKEIIIIIVCAFLGVAALAVTYFIPQHAMSNNVRDSAAILHDEGLHPYIWQTIDETVLDGTTDGLMLNISYTETGDGLRDILLGTWGQVDDKKAVLSLYELLVKDNHSNYKVRTYGRYWHGYQVLLRPLLCLFTYADIRQINMAIQLAVVLWLVYILTKLGGGKERKLIFPFFGMFFFLSPITMSSALQYSSCFYVMMLTLIALFALKGYLDDEKRNFVFLLDGVLVAYFDFLTYPMITLAVPLIAYLATDEECLYSWKKGVKDVIKYTVSWGIGYVGMWAMKWIIGSVLTDENIMLDAIEQIKYRSGRFNTDFTYLETVKLNLGVCNKSVILAGLAAGLICVIGWRIIRHERVEWRMLPSMGVILFVASYPFAWYFVAENHSGNHYWFAWRNLGISVFGFLVLLTVNSKKKDKKAELQE